MLDPIAEKAFLGLLFRANRELGITVVVATHAPQAMAEYATCAFAVGEGRVREVELSALAKPRPLAALPARRRPQVPPPSTCGRRGFATTATATGCFAALTCG